MDAAREMIFMAYPERRRQRIGDVNGVATRTEKITRRTTRPVEDTVHETEDHDGFHEAAAQEETAPTADRRVGIMSFTRRDAREEVVAGTTTRTATKRETDSEQDARVAREKAAWAEEEKRRGLAEEIFHANLNQSSKLAAQVGLPDLFQWKARNEVQRVDLDREVEQSDAQAEMATTATQISHYMAEAASGANSWEYRRAILGKARVQVGSHITEISALKNRYHDKFAEFAGAPQASTEVEQRMAELDKRRQFLEDYYGVLDRLASNDDFAASDMSRLGSNNPEVTPEMVRNSSRMKLGTRRRRRVWSDVA